MDKFAAALLACALSLPALAQQQPPTPDPRIEQVISQTLIVAMERSVTPEKTVPPVKVARPAAPGPEYRRVDDGVYVDRRLLPPGGRVDDPEAVRIYRGDR